VKRQRRRLLQREIAEAGAQFNTVGELASGRFGWTTAEARDILGLESTAKNLRAREFGADAASPYESRAPELTADLARAGVIRPDEDDNGENVKRRWCFNR